MQLKKVLIGIGIILGALIPSAALAITITPVQQGGTGWGAPGNINPGSLLFGDYGGFRLATSSQLSFATSTGTLTANALTISGITGSTQCLHVNTSGVVSGTASDCGTGSGGVTSVAATYPILTTAATGAITLSTAFGTTTNWGMGNNGFVVTSATGIPFTVASSSLHLPNSALTNSTISGVALGSNLNNLTINNGGAGSASGATYNGSGAVTISYNTVGAQVAGTYLTALGSGWATTTATGITFSTTTATVNGLTYGMTIVPAAGSLAFTPTVTGTYNGQAGSVANAVTFNNGGSGAASGQTFNGSAAATISYNTLGAVPTGRLPNTTYPVQGGGDLSADRTITLAFGTTTQNFWNAYNNFSSLFATISSTTNATTTTLAITGAGASNCNGTSALTTNSTGVVGCTEQPQGTVTSVTGTYPVQSSGGATPAISIAFGTTTSNTWAGTQTFTNPLVDGTLSGLIGGNSGATYAVSTTSMNASITGSAGSVANALTFNNSGSGAASGQTFNGSAAATISYNTIGAQIAGNYDTFAYPFPSSATSSLLTFTGGFISTGSTTFSGNATTTGYGSIGTLYLPNISGTQCLHSINSVVSGTGSDCGTGGGGTGAATTSFAGTYPVQLVTSASAITYSLAFGTTTANTWSGLQAFTNLGTTTFSGPIQMQGWYIGTSTTVCLYPNTCQYQANSTAADVAINNAITFVQNQGGGTVNIQPGTYTLNAPITISADGVVLKGEGNNGTILKAKNNLNDYMVKVNDGALRSRLEFRNLKFDGNISNETAGGCIMASSTARSTFDDLWLESCFNEALKLTGPAGGGFGYNNTVENSYIANNKYGIVLINNDENQIFANTINSSSVYHIWDEQGLQNIHDNVFTGVVYTTGIGIYSYFTQNSQYSNNTFDSVPQESIALLCNTSTQGHHLVRGNYFFTSDNSGTGKATIRDDGCVGNQIVGNYSDPTTKAPYFYQEVNNASIGTYFNSNVVSATSTAYNYAITANASTTNWFTNATTTPPNTTYWGGINSTGSLQFNMPTGYGTVFSVNGTSQVTINSSGLTLNALTGTQCLHEISGVVSGTGADCGAGGASFGKTFEIGLNQYSVNALIPTTTVPLFIQSTATSSFQGGVSAPIFNATSTTATSTFANGINLSGGCFSILGICIGGGGGSGSTVTTKHVSNGTGANVYAIFPVVSGDTVTWWVHAHGSTCLNGNTLDVSAQLKQSTMAATTTQSTGDSGGQNQNLACSTSAQGYYSATTTETVTVSGVNGGGSYDGMDIIAQKTSTSAGGSGSVGNWFTPQSDGNATSTELIFNQGFLSTASSTINGNATTTGTMYMGVASTTALYVQGAANIISTAVSTFFNGLKVLTELIIPTSSSPSLSNSGDIAINTTTASSSLQFNDGGATRALFPDSFGGLTLASSTLAQMGKYTGQASTYAEFGTGSASTTAACSTAGINTSASLAVAQYQTLFLAVGNSSGTTTLNIANPPRKLTILSWYCKMDAASSPNVITITPDIRKEP